MKTSTQNILLNRIEILVGRRARYAPENTESYKLQHYQNTKHTSLTSQAVLVNYCF